LEYRKLTAQDLNYHLTTYVDLKYTTMWSDDFLKKKKWELKDNSKYFRIVKSGSMLVYLTLHIFMIFIILLAATLRQSLIALGYVLILLPRIKDGAEVLKQRDIQLKKQAEKIRKEVEVIKDELGQEDIFRKFIEKISVKHEDATVEDPKEFGLEK
jgi:hypothetical protein